MSQAEDKAQEHNPKRNPAQSNTQKDPEDWVTGGEPMTGAQASYMKTLSEIADEPDAFDESLTKAEASIRIDELKEKPAAELALRSSAGRGDSRRGGDRAPRKLRG